MTRQRLDFTARIALLLLIAWQCYVIYHYQHLLRDAHGQMQKATAQLNEDVAVMNRLRKACGLQQTSWNKSASALNGAQRKVKGEQ